MTGFDCICEAIEVFEKSLGHRTASGQGPIRSVSEWAKRTGYSVYHFTRLFSAVAGLSPKDYLSGRILTEAAKAIAESNLPLAQVALRGGYPDYETFSRAFKRQFSVSPRQIRNQQTLPEGVIQRCIPRQNPASAHLHCKEPEVVDRQAFSLVGLPFYIEPGTPSLHAPWATFLKVEGRVARLDPPIFYQFSSWLEGAEQGMSILCGLEADPKVPQDPLFTHRPIPAARYLRFVHTGEVTTIGSTYQYIYGDWLAHHDAKPAPGWEFQRYPHETKIEIWIPLVQ